MLIYVHQSKYFDPYNYLDSKLYINRNNGKLCIIKSTSKKIYTIYLDGKIDNDLNTISDIKWKYMSLIKFFSLSEYSDGFEIQEKNGIDTISLGDYNTNYLYFTQELCLCLIDDSENIKFNFISSVDDYDFVKGNNSQITRNSYFDYYKKKDRCLADLLLYLKNTSKDKNNKKSL